MKGGDSQWTARCPAHGDRHQSLSVGVGKDGRILLTCHTGCGLDDILDAMGLQKKDLFPDKPQNQTSGKPPVVAVYTYPSGAQKLRRADKSFTWRRPDKSQPSGWAYNRKGVPHELYIAGELGGLVHVCEGEKDCINFYKHLGGCAVSGADGAGPGKWKPEYTEQLRGRPVVILQDNDGVGRAYAQQTAAALHGVAKSVRVIDLSRCWPEIPEHGDISDMIEALGAAEAALRLAKLEKETPEWSPGGAAPDPLLSLFKPLSDFPEEEAKWLIEGWIPEGQISIIAADGGIGKTTLWCNIVAALSNGTSCVLDPPGTVRKPLRVMFLTTEDSVRKKLRKKLRLAGANMKNIVTPDFVGDRSGLLHKLKFGTPEMDKVLRTFKPALCIFDPVQGFTPPKVNMGSRNEMRDCMAPLISIGEDINTTALIVCHTNKRKGAYGRDRIADSADIWDIARSVMMAGYTEDQGVRYLSNEKNNYAQLQETVLFAIDADGQIQREGTSWKRDRDYIIGAEFAKTAPKREDCKAFILQTLEDAGGAMPTDDLDNTAKSAGYSFSSLKRAKADLKREKAVEYFTTGSAKDGDRTWHIRSLSSGFVEEDESTPTPFDEAAAV